MVTNGPLSPSEEPSNAGPGIGPSDGDPPFSDPKCEECRVVALRPERLLAPGMIAYSLCERLPERLFVAGGA